MMKQAEIWCADLNPVKGNEQAGYRPIVILSGNLLNEHLGVVIACPLTTKIKNYKGNPVLKPNEKNGLAATSEILVLHVSSIAKERLVQKIGQIEAKELELMVKTLGEIIKY